jgi:hypothetical protein
VPVEIAISDFPTQLEPSIIARTLGRRSKEVRNRSIRVSKSKKLSHIGIAICDCPTRSEPFDSRMRVRGSSGIGVQKIQDFRSQRIAYVEITIRDFPTGLKTPSGGQVSEG